MRHELKCWPEYFRAIIDGDKTFEVRKDDRGFEVGDELILREYILAEDRYTGRELLVDVTYLMRGESWGIQHGIVVMAIRPRSKFDSLSEPWHP